MHTVFTLDRWLDAMAGLHGSSTSISWGAGTSGGNGWENGGIGGVGPVK